MICVFDIGNEMYTGNGDAVLQPTKCSHRQAAAGKYDLTITHPIDPAGKWKHIVPEAIIRAPVPEETIETAVSGIAADVYTVKNNGTALRKAASEPEAITYPDWNWQTPYSVGDKVTCASWTSHHNYQCTYYDSGSQQVMAPPYNSSWWTPIQDTTGGSPVLVTLKAGTELFYIEAAGVQGWAKVSTMYGMEGYIKTSQIEYSRHLTPAETQPRVIRDQLFRIRKVTRSTDGKSVTATAEHVSYDLAGILIDDADIHEKSAAFTLAWIEQAFMMDYRGLIATNLTGDDDGTYTGRITGKNAIYALLDPDKGVVGSFDAMYRRDNWDVFVMRKEETDRGFRLQYGRNLRGVNWDMNTDGLITRVVPVAKAEDGSDLYLEDPRWVDSPKINQYPVVRMERIKVDGQVGKDDGTESATNWTEETLREKMEEKAEARFSVDKVDEVVHAITVDFEMLGDTDEYQALRQLEQVLMYDTIECRHEEIGLDVTAEVTEIEFDCIRKKITGLVLSNVNAKGGRNVSGFNVVNNSITPEKLTDSVGDEFKRYTDDAGTDLQKWVTNNFVHR